MLCTLACILLGVGSSACGAQDKYKILSKKESNKQVNVENYVQQ